MEIVLNEHNTNQHTERGDYMLRTSFEQVGARRSAVADKDGVIVAGNGAVKAALAAGFPLEVIPATSDRLVVLQYDDLDIDGIGDAGDKARLYEVLDNRASEVGLAWNPVEMQRMHAEGVNLLQAFTHSELASNFNIELRETHDEIIQRFALPVELPELENDATESVTQKEIAKSSQTANALAPRCAVSIVLTSEQKSKWDEFKKQNGLHNDLKAFLYILDLYFEPFEEGVGQE